MMLGLVLATTVLGSAAPSDDEMVVYDGVKVPKMIFANEDPKSKLTDIRILSVVFWGMALAESLKHLDWVFVKKHWTKAGLFPKGGMVTVRALFVLTMLVHSATGIATTLLLTNGKFTVLSTSTLVGSCVCNLVYQLLFLAIDLIQEAHIDGRILFCVGCLKILGSGAAAVVVLAYLFAGGVGHLFESLRSTALVVAKECTLVGNVVFVVFMAYSEIVEQRAAAMLRGNADEAVSPRGKMPGFAGMDVPGSSLNERASATQRLALQIAASIMMVLCSVTTIVPHSVALALIAWITAVTFTERNSAALRSFVTPNPFSTSGSDEKARGEADGVAVSTVEKFVKPESGSVPVELESTAAEFEESTDSGLLSPRTDVSSASLPGEVV